MTTDRPPPLGWPWDQLADATLRWDDARRRLQVAQVLAGTVDTEEVRHDPAERKAAREAAYQAQMDLDRAVTDRAALRAELANQWLIGMRAALELYPLAVMELFDGQPPPDQLVEAVKELEDRVDAAEDAIVNLEHGSVCR